MTPREQEALRTIASSVDDLLRALPTLPHPHLSHEEIVAKCAKIIDDRNFPVGAVCLMFAEALTRLKELESL